MKSKRIRLSSLVQKGCSNLPWRARGFALCAAFFISCITSGLSAAIPYSGDLNPTNPNSNSTGYNGQLSAGTDAVNGGNVLTSRSCDLGYDVGFTGRATITGINSRWSNGGNVYLGYSRVGALSIEAGAQFTNTSTTYLAFNAGSTGTITVNDVVIAAVPEPAVVVFLGRASLGLLACTLSRDRDRRNAA